MASNHIFVPSIEEIIFMLEPKRYARILSEADGGDIMDAVSPDLVVSLGDRILAMGVKILLIKAGHRGAYLRTGDVFQLNAATSFDLPVANWNCRDLWIPAFPADQRRVRNACGAGDCAVAGFLAAILEGADIVNAGRYAMLAGRDNLYGIDALSGLSNWQQMTRRLEAPGRSGRILIKHCRKPGRPAWAPWTSAASIRPDPGGGEKSRNGTDLARVATRPR
jgi:sugar/nucleoside kinase (ribokinase family)